MGLIVIAGSPGLMGLIVIAGSPGLMGLMDAVVMGRPFLWLKVCIALMVVASNVVRHSPFWSGPDPGCVGGGADRRV